jgi:hypothetical protein
MKFHCPECGVLLDSDRIDLIAHAQTHWPVSPNHLDRIRNEKARKRYEVIIEAAKKAAIEDEQVTPKMGNLKESVEQQAQED